MFSTIINKPEVVRIISFKYFNEIHFNYFRTFKYRNIVYQDFKKLFKIVNKKHLNLYYFKKNVK